LFDWAIHSYIGKRQHDTFVARLPFVDLWQGHTWFHAAIIFNLPHTPGRIGEVAAAANARKLFSFDVTN